ncbi:MAG: hypothetical protein K1X86_09665 [Ignavibacteria bacterium]|nr:hypothetical protein [Ignavibacteria bacterium]
MINQYNKSSFTVDFRFIQQYKAIPENCRREFYYLLKWKNPVKFEKRIKLIEIVERYLSLKIKPKWQNELVIKKIGTNRDSYYCLKSRLLKSIREFYFTGKLEGAFIKAKRKSDEIGNAIKSIRSKASLGMVREAKTALYRCEKQIRQKTDLTSEDVIILTEIYEFLVVYYHRQRNKTAFNTINKKLSLLPFNKFKFDKTEKALISIRKNIANAFSEIFLVRSGKSTETALKNYLKASKIAKQNGLDKYYLKMLFYAGNILHETGRVAKAYEIFTEALHFSQLRKMKSEKNIFHTKLMLLDFLKDNSKANEYMAQSGKYYDDAINHPYDVDYTMHILFHYLRFTSFCGYGEKFKFLSEELVNRLFLYSRKADAVFRWYALEADKYIEEMYYWHEEDTNIKVNVNKGVLDAFENFNYGALLQFGKFYSYDQLSFVYNTQIELEFWKGRKCNFENAHYYINKMKRIEKKISSYSNTEMVNTLKLCLKIMEESMYKKDEDVFVKFLPEIKALFIKLKSREKNYNLSTEYSFLSFTAEILNVNEFLLMVKSFEKWIRINQPGNFEALLEINRRRVV